MIAPLPIYIPSVEAYHLRSTYGVQCSDSRRAQERSQEIYSLENASGTRQGRIKNLKMHQERINAKSPSLDPAILPPWPVQHVSSFRIEA